MATLNEGRDNVVNLIGSGLSADKFGSVAIGTSANTVSDTQGRLSATLDTQSGLSAVASGNTMSLVGTFTGNSATVREALLYANTNTVALARQVISTVNVQNSDTLEITWEVKVSDA